MSIKKGDKFGRWTVVGRAQPGPDGKQVRSRFMVRCVCGREAIRNQKDLTRPGRSSGCRSRKCQTRWEATQAFRKLLYEALDAALAEFEKGMAE